MTEYFIGVDLGQAQDPSTIAVVERVELCGEFDAAVWAYRKLVELRLRGLERIPLGTPYREVAERVAEVTRSPKLKGAVRLVIDATGVGRPMMELVRSARPEGRMKGVVVTAGHEQTMSGSYYCVPKQDLMMGLQLLFEGGGLRMARSLKEGPTLQRELVGLKQRISSIGRVQYGGGREGKHDDLVFAVALAYWEIQQTYRRPDEYWQDKEEAERVLAFQKARKWEE